jgi:hypothetical protein
VSRARRRSKLPTALTRAVAFALLLLAAALGRAWALPGRAPLGQTIPPPPTFTRTKTVSAQPTATWTPRPTWTRVATQPPAPSTATPTLVVGVPTVTHPLQPTATGVAGQATATSMPPTPGLTMTSTLPGPTATSPALHPTLEFTSTPSGPRPTAGGLSPPPPSVTPAPEPNALAFEVVVLPQAAGPQDAVQFILQVANVGYEPVDDVQVAVVFPADLWLQFVECPRCTTDCPQCGGGPVIGPLTILIGRLLPGDQIIAPVHMEVAGDVWPGRTLRTDWTLAATGVPAQAVEADLLLPWAPLPDTGGE